jgi:hypothetical protein
VVTVGVGVDDRVDGSARGDAADPVEHLLRQTRVEQRVDEQAGP